MRALRTILWAAVVLLTGACGSGADGPQPVPADALPGEPGEVVELDAAIVAGDAIDFAALEDLLEDAGFAGGTQRVFSQSEGPRQQRSLARMLAFSDADGARRYLDWLQDHMDEVIGTSELLDPPDVQGAAFLAVSSGDCDCPKPTEVFLAAWRKGSTVLSLEVGGEGVAPQDVQALVTQLDEGVSV